MTVVVAYTYINGGQRVFDYITVDCGLSDDDKNDNEFAVRCVRKHLRQLGAPEDIQTLVVSERSRYTLDGTMF